MKREDRRKRPREANQMRPEYRFDYRKARPNRFAGRIQAGAVAVVLDPDVASVFGSSETVNALLRSVISAMPDSFAYQWISTKRPSWLFSIGSSSRPSRTTAWCAAGSAGLPGISLWRSAVEERQPKNTGPRFNVGCNSIRRFRIWSWVRWSMPGIQSTRPLQPTAYARPCGRWLLPLCSLARTIRLPQQFTVWTVRPPSPRDGLASRQALPGPRNGRACR